MSIAAANLFTRNIWREYIKPDLSDSDESQVAKLVSLVVKAGALFFIVFLPTAYAINLQLLGGVWIIQILPALVVGLYTRWLLRTALLIGWAVGMLIGTGMAIQLNVASSVYPLQVFGFTIAGYAAVWGVIANFVVAIVLTWVFNAMRVAAGRRPVPSPADYTALAPEPAPRGSLPPMSGMVAQAARVLHAAPPELRPGRPGPRSGLARRG